MNRFRKLSSATLVIIAAIVPNVAQADWERAVLVDDKPGDGGIYHRCFYEVIGVGLRFAMTIKGVCAAIVEYDPEAGKWRPAY